MSPPPSLMLLFSNIDIGGDGCRPMLATAGCADAERFAGAGVEGHFAFEKERERESESTLLLFAKTEPLIGRQSVFVSVTMIIFADDANWLPLEFVTLSFCLLPLSWLAGIDDDGGGRVIEAPTAAVSVATCSQADFWSQFLRCFSWDDVDNRWSLNNLFIPLFPLGFTWTSLHLVSTFACLFDYLFVQSCSLPAGYCIQILELCSTSIWGIAIMAVRYLGFLVKSFLFLCSGGSSLKAL